jgi:anti-sigma regulatory factor (Ser/Thr protein kinase)
MSAFIVFSGNTSLHADRFQIQLVSEWRLMLSDDVTMESRLSRIPAIFEALRSDSELQSRIEGRKTAFCIAVSGALANAMSHGNCNKPSKESYVRWTYKLDGALSILIRDEGKGFNPENIATPKDIDEDRNRGIRLVRSCTDEIQFQNNGRDVHIRMNALGGHQLVSGKSLRRRGSNGGKRL